MNALEDNGDWSIYIALFVAGGFPWITQIKNLDLHFSYGGQSFKEVFNAFASLFSFSIFFFMKAAVSDRFAFFFGFWWAILLIAFLLIVVYLYILMYRRENKGIYGMLIAFVIYVSIFCTLVGGFGLLYFEKDYYMISGKIEGVKNEKVKIEIYSGNKLTKAVLSDRDGDFYLTLRKDMQYDEVHLLYPGSGPKTFYIYDPIYTTFGNLRCSN